MRKQNKGHRKVRKCKAGPNFSGQHLMHNKQIIQEMLELAKVTSRDTVFELGAGKGALTFPLVQKAGKVIAVENDPKFAEVLRKKADALSLTNIRILERDILQTRLPKEPFHVVANIPYSITTPILEMLLQQPSEFFQGGVLVIEEGAAKRFTSVPILNPRILAWRMLFDLKLARVVSRDSFSPPPRVDSAILRIRRKDQPGIPFHQQRQFLAFASYALKYPQLSIQQALKEIFTAAQMKRMLKEIGTEREAPICTLNEEQWGTVFQTMLRYVQPFRWPRSI